MSTDIAKDSHITIKSGRFGGVHGGTRGGNMLGNTFITIYEGATVAAANSGNDTGSDQNTDKVVKGSGVIKLVGANVDLGAVSLHKSVQGTCYLDLTEYTGEVKDKWTPAGITVIKAGEKLPDDIQKAFDKAPDVYDLSGEKNLVYISDSGNDENDGKTPETAWKTTAKVSGVAFKKGDGVFFKRGDIFRGGLTTREYTSYGAYGEGAKPIIMLSPENGAGEEKWTLVEGTTDIYKYHIEMNDLGGVVCMDKDGKVVNFMEKVCLYNDANGYYDNAKSYKYYKEILDYIKELPAESGDVCVNGKVSTDVLRYKSDIYVRCAAGNPGKVYASIEFINGGSAVISGRSNVNIDNLALFYGSRHGIGAGTVQNLVITNCEIGYIGGGYQNYGGTTIVRYGNGIEVYGGCDNFVIDNCYVYQCYDAGITNQLQKGGSENYTEQNVKFTNNVLVDSCYNIE